MDLWILFVVIAGVLFSLEGLIGRHVLRNQNDFWTYSFFFSAVGALVSLPFFLASPRIPAVVENLDVWLLALLAVILLVAHNALAFASMRYLSPSVSGSLVKLRFVWLFALGALVLGEAPNMAKAVGTVLIVVSGLVVLNVNSGKGHYRSVIYSVTATVCAAAFLVLSKHLLEVFTTQSFTFLVVFLPVAILNALVIRQFATRVKALWKLDGRMTALACASGALANLAMNAALKHGEATRVAVLVDSFLVMTLVAEYFILRESGNPWRKLLAVALSIGGAALVVGR